MKQLIGDADWGELDYFILDTPPGTSDIHLTLVQTLAITGAVIVSTPQQVALADARKGINMYTNDKVNVPILGLVENMSWFTPAELPEINILSLERRSQAIGGRNECAFVGTNPYCTEYL